MGVARWSPTSPPRFESLTLERGPPHGKARSFYADLGRRKAILFCIPLLGLYKKYFHFDNNKKKKNHLRYLQMYVKNNDLDVKYYMISEDPVKIFK